MKQEVGLRDMLLGCGLLFVGCASTSATDGSDTDPSSLDLDNDFDGSASCADSTPYSFPWKISEPFTSTPPTDGGGRAWYDLDFEYDLTWSSSGDVSTAANLSEGESLVARVDFLFDPYPKDGLHFEFSADDGIALYINETEMGVWGGDATTPGCVNRSCDNAVTVDPVSLDGVAFTGDNLIAIMLTNAQAGAWFEADLVCR